MRVFEISKKISNAGRQSIHLLRQEYSVHARVVYHWFKFWFIIIIIVIIPKGKILILVFMFLCSEEMIFSVLVYNIRKEGGLFASSKCMFDCVKWYKRRPLERFYLLVEEPPKRGKSHKAAL